MTTIEILPPEQQSVPTNGYRVDPHKGSHSRRVSSEWFNRPDDERFLSLDELFTTVKRRSDHSESRIIESKAIVVESARNDPENLSLILPGGAEPVHPTHWAFGQLSGMIGAPATYMRQLPAPIAAINLQYGLAVNRSEQVKTFETQDGRTELRAITGPDYGRIHDAELIEAVQRIAGNGTGDTRWKVPGALDWSTGIYNPNVDITKDTTTLYASDRDVFLFLVDDRNPIEAGKLDDGSPDLFFRGFYCWNSEVGAKTLGVASFYLRAVCQNRCLWGIEDFQEIKIRHSKFAASRFAYEAAPAIENFANSSAIPFVNGINASRERIVAKNDDDRNDFLKKQGFSKAETEKIIKTILEEEGHPPRSVFDFVQGIAAHARSKKHQDTRLILEGKAKKLLEKAV
ncbi:DUF932 domain-containing protein [Bartonella sp. LJL80]